LVTRRYWPQSGPNERLLSALTSAWARQGHSTVIITSGWGQGPSRFVEDGREVVRLSSPRSSLWSGNSYLRELNRTLSKLRNDVDLILVSGFDRELSTTAKSIRSVNTPLVVRYEQDGILAAPQRIAKAVERATAFVASNDTALNELKAKGLPPDKLHLVENSLPTTWEDDTSQTAARITLAKTHDLFQLPVGGKLGVYIGPLTREQGLFELIGAWKTIGEQHPDARLWIIGEGADGPELWRRTVDAQLEYQIIFPGLFDDATDLLRAADFIVQPSQRDTGLETAAEATLHGTHLLVSDLPEIRASLVLAKPEQVVYIPPNNQAALTQEIGTLLCNLPADKPSQLRTPSQLNTGEESSNTMADEYIALFRKLVALNAAN